MCIREHAITRAHGAHTHHQMHTCACAHMHTHAHAHSSADAPQKESTTTEVVPQRENGLVISSTVDSGEPDTLADAAD